jgi:hypothetical protein
MVGSIQTECELETVMRGNIATLKPIEKGENLRGGRGGRVPGQTNITTRLMKRALILAAEQSDHSDDGTLVGYVRWIANTRPDLFCSMLGRMVPMEAKIQTAVHPSDLRLDPSMDLATMIQTFEMKIKSGYRPPPRAIEHDGSDDDDDEFER